MTDMSPLTESSTPVKPCSCLTRIQTALAKQNTYIDTARWENLDTGQYKITVRIPTLKLDSRSRKRAELIAPAFCPFCGQCYVYELQAVSQPPTEPEVAP